MPVMNINLFSITLRYGIDCMVVLPENLKKGEKLKCLWLYHGGSGDHTAWLYHTPLVELAEEKHFAAVLPNVHESCFVNMNIGDAFGTFVGKELPSVIWTMFACISGERQDNYIAGFSNGGYGCLHTALSYPQKFAGVGAHKLLAVEDIRQRDDGDAERLGRVCGQVCGCIGKNAVTHSNSLLCNLICQIRLSRY